MGPGMSTRMVGGVIQRWSGCRSMLFMPNVRENLGLEVARAGFSYYGRLGTRRTNEGEDKQKLLSGLVGLD